MALAGSPSLREIRARAKVALEAATLPSAPAIVDSPVNPTDADALPEIHLFDGGRNSSGNSAQKLYRGAVLLSLGVEITVKMKGTYADVLDELTDAVLQVLLTSDNVLEGIGKIESYNTRPEFEKAETPLARNIITVNMSTQEKFVTAETAVPQDPGYPGNPTDAGNPAALEELETTIKTSEDVNKNTTVILRPPQT